MCYSGCQYERYPHGPNEGCVCKRGKNPCPSDEQVCTKCGAEGTAQAQHLWYCEDCAREMLLGE